MRADCDRLVTDAAEGLRGLDIVVSNAVRYLSY